MRIKFPVLYPCEKYLVNVVQVSQAMFSELRLHFNVDFSRNADRTSPGLISTNCFGN